MKKRLLGRPREAWTEDSFSQGSSSPRSWLSSAYEVTVLQPLKLDESWLPVYKMEQEAVDFIVTFVTGLNKEERQKVTFLKSIHTMCRTAFTYGLTDGLDLFCCTYKLANIVKMLLQDEPRDRLRTEIRHLSMMVIEELSLVESVLEGKTKSLVSACFSSVFCLPPENEMSDQDIPLYVKTMASMDNMLRTMVLSSSVSKKLQDIFEILLDFTRSEREIVRERAVGRIDVLAHLLSDYSTSHACFDIERDVPGPGDIPILGKLLGRLILFRFSKEQTSYPAFHALFSLADFIFESRLQDRARQLHWEAATTSSLCSFCAGDCTKAFGKYLQPHERTDIILVAIEAMRDANFLDKQVPSSMLNAALEDPDFWLTDAPQIVSSILENLEYIDTQSAWEKVESLLLLLTNQYPTIVIGILCKTALQGDRAELQLWDLMSSMPEILDKILKEYAMLLQKRCFYYSIEGTHNHHKASSSRKSELEELDDETDIKNDHGCTNGTTASLLLEGLVGLSKRAEMARKIEIFLPGMMKILQFGSKKAKMKILEAFQNVLGQLNRTKASFVAVQLAGRLLPLFDSECSQLQELSICMFTDLLGLVAGRDEKRMKKEVRKALIPLLFRVNDQNPSVAKASREALLAAAELLRWKTFRHLLKRERMWELGACLVSRSMNRAEDYIHQSLPYLKDPQPNVRLAAIRFIGLITRRLSEQTIASHVDLLDAVEPLETDRDISVSSLAAQTTLYLRTPSVHQRPRSALQMFCSCWR